MMKIFGSEPGLWNPVQRHFQERRQFLTGLRPTTNNENIRQRAWPLESGSAAFSGEEPGDRMAPGDGALRWCRPVND
jgi:hypothetical protein